MLNKRVLEEIAARGPLAELESGFVVGVRDGHVVATMEDERTILLVALSAMEAREIAAGLIEAAEIVEGITVNQGDHRC